MWYVYIHVYSYYDILQESLYIRYYEVIPSVMGTLLSKILYTGILHLYLWYDKGTGICDKLACWTFKLLKNKKKEVFQRRTFFVLHESATVTAVYQVPVNLHYCCTSGEVIVAMAVWGTEGTMCGLVCVCVCVCVCVLGCLRSLKISQLFL